MRRIFTTLLISIISINTSAQKEFANRYWFGILEGASLPQRNSKPNYDFIKSWFDFFKSYFGFYKS
jgi:hypothetical protein